MEEFIGESIEIEKAQKSPRPLHFSWRDGNHKVAAVLREWVPINRDWIRHASGSQP